jgi:hypothetical protein
MDLQLAPALTRLAGGRPFHFSCMPGLVPDGPETFARQRRLLRARGSVAILTYPYAGFDLDQVVDAVSREVDAANAAGAAPVLFGLSVGGGILIEALRRARDAGRPLAVHGVILVSPLTCTDDLSSMLQRLTFPIIEEATREGGKPGVALERGRALFKSLVTRAADEKPKTLARWLGPVGVLTPQGFTAWWESRLLTRIQHTLDRISPEGAVARVQAMRSFRGLHGLRGPLSEVPTLLLWGSKERQTLDMDGPGTGRLCRPDLACRIFPDAEVHWVYDRDGGEVPHASLLKHAKAFNPLLTRWLKRQSKARGVDAQTTKSPTDGFRVVLALP